MFPPFNFSGLEGSGPCLRGQGLQWADMVQGEMKRSSKINCSSQRTHSWEHVSPDPVKSGCSCSPKQVLCSLSWVLEQTPNEIPVNHPCVGGNLIYNAAVVKKRTTQGVVLYECNSLFTFSGFSFRVNTFVGVGNGVN